MAGRKANPILFGYVFTGFACLFIGVGGWLAWDQARLLKTAVAVPAVIDAARVDSHRGGKGTLIYKAVVDFTYRIDGVPHTGHDPLQMAFSTSSPAPAEEVIARVRAAAQPATVGDSQPAEQPGERPPGAAITAWVDPADPDKAFLLRETSFFPYLFILFPMIHATIGLCLVMLSKQEPAVVVRRLRHLITLWYGLGLLVIGHYSAAGGQWTVLPVLGILVYAALGSPLLFVRRHYAKKVVAEAV